MWLVVVNVPNKGEAETAGDGHRGFPFIPVRTRASWSCSRAPASLRFDSSFGKKRSRTLKQASLRAGYGVHAALLWEHTLASLRPFRI